MFSLKKFILAGERLDRWFDVIVNEIEAILRSTGIGDAKGENWGKWTLSWVGRSENVPR